MAQTAALYHVSFKSYKKNTKVSYILKPILVQGIQGILYGNAELCKVTVRHCYNLYLYLRCPLTI